MLFFVFFFNIIIKQVKISVIIITMWIIFLHKHRQFLIQGFDFNRVAAYKILLEE